MKDQQRLTLLTIDSIINVVLGISLLAMLGATIEFFRLPTKVDNCLGGFLAAVFRIWKKGLSNLSIILLYRKFGTMRN